MQETITGVLVREPQIRYTTQGVAQTILEIEDQDGNFVQVICYGTLAENVALSLTKGNLVTVVGKMPPVTFEATEVAVSLRKATVEIAQNHPNWGGDE